MIGLSTLKKAFEITRVESIFHQKNQRFAKIRIDIAFGMLCAPHESLSREKPERACPRLGGMRVAEK